MLHVVLLMKRQGHLNFYEYMPVYLNSPQISYWNGAHFILKDHLCISCCFFLRGEPFDRGLVHSIESVIIEWTHQIQSVLKRNSAQPLLEGHNPGPLVELDFWKARAANLECIFEQVSITSTAEIDSISINCYLFYTQYCSFQVFTK